MYTCLIEVLIKNLFQIYIIGWSESFENLSMHTKLVKALAAPHISLHKQLLVYIPCKNGSTLSTEVSMESSFLENTCYFQFPKDCFIFWLCVMSSRLFDNFCNLVWDFSASDCFPDNRTTSSLIFGYSGCIACSFHAKIVTLGWLVAEVVAEVFQHL